MRSRRRKKQNRKVLLILSAASAVLLILFTSFSVLGDEEGRLIYGILRNSGSTEKNSISIYDGEDVGAVRVPSPSRDSVEQDTDLDGTLVYGAPVGEAVSFGGSGGITIYPVASSQDAESWKPCYAALKAYVYLRRIGFSGASASAVAGNFCYEDTDGNWDLVLFELEDMLKEAKEVMDQEGSETGFDEFMTLEEPEEAAVLWDEAVCREASLFSEQIVRKNAADYYAEWGGYSGENFDIIEDGMQFIGNPYVFAGNSLTQGIDCSHYVWQILTRTGRFTGEYVNSAELRYLGTEITDYADLQPGDVLCWNHHVAFYLGEDYYLNAASPSLGICVLQGDIRNILGGLLSIRRF